MGDRRFRPERTTAPAAARPLRTGPSRPRATTRRVDLSTVEQLTGEGPAHIARTGSSPASARAAWGWST